MLRSVLVWLDLGDAEELYLEGAEDLNRIQGAAALTEQLKDTAGSGNVTFRISSVIDAISHFWDMRRVRRMRDVHSAVAKARQAGDRK